MKPHRKLAWIVAATTALATTFSQAAIITWSVIDITGNVTDVSTVGTLVDSRAGSDYGTLDVVDGSSFTVNGVTFDDDLTLDTPNKYDTIGSRAGTYSAANSDYFTLLNNADRDTDGANSVTFTTITIGSVYQIQVWAADNANTAQDRALVLNDGSAAAANINTAGHATVLFEAGAEGSYGQYAIGTFTADSTTQAFKAQHYNNLTTGTPAATTQLFINAVQLRLIPEPTSALLGGLGLLALLRRRRNA